MVIVFYSAATIAARRTAAASSFPTQERTRREALKWFCSTEFGAGVTGGNHAIAA